MNFLKNTNCYLSGAIDNDAHVNWRPPVIKALTDRFGINVFDPFSDPKQNKSKDIQEAKRKRDKKAVQEIVSGFVRKDLAKVDRSDFIVARIGMEEIYYPKDLRLVGGFEADILDGPHWRQIPTTGTIHEIINSDLYHKPTLLVCEQGWWNLPGWLLGFIPTDYWFSSWDELYQYLENVDRGDHTEDDRWHYVYQMV